MVLFCKMATYGHMPVEKFNFDCSALSALQLIVRAVMASSVKTARLVEEDTFCIKVTQI